MCSAQQRAFRPGSSIIALHTQFLLCIPKKYPRLLLGLTPVSVALISLQLRTVRQSVRAALLVLAAGWLVYGSTNRLPGSFFHKQVDDRSRQIWLRPYDGRDFGLSFIARYSRDSPAGAIAIANAPQFPPDIQTTHGWAYHVEPYLRRSGIEREIYETEPGTPEWSSAVIRLRWYGELGENPLPLYVNGKKYADMVDEENQ